MRLRKPCQEHGLYDAHGYWPNDRFEHKPEHLLWCEGGEFLADDALIIEKVDEALRVISEHFASALIPVRSEMKARDLVAVCNAHARRLLDALTVREGAE